MPVRLVNVDENAPVIATLTIGSNRFYIRGGRSGAEGYNVSFYDYYRALVNKQLVQPGGDAIAPPMPEYLENGLVFRGWDTSYVDVQADLDVHSIFE